MTDIYCDIIDNYGDMAFAIKVINTFFVQKQESEFRFFGNNPEVFHLFEKNFLSGIYVSYIDIQEIKNSIPSSHILNLFERKIDYSFLESFDFPIHLTHFSYFSLEPYNSTLSPGIQAWHGKISKHKNLTVEQFGVSLLPNTGGVLNEKNYLPEIFSKDYFIESYWLPRDKKWISVFCYPETLSFFETEWFFEVPEDILFLSFGKKISEAKNVFELPFLSMQEYYSLLQHCEGNIVRGENSLIPALESPAPFFWDIYKEKNNAHRAKIEDFAVYLRSLWYSEALIQVQLEGNRERKYEKVKEVFFS